MDTTSESAGAQKKRDPKLAIYGAIGVFNTAFDMALYVFIQYVTGSIIIANVAATTAALIGSYLLHSKFTFKARKWKVSTFILFAGVTIFGLWVLQTYAIYLLTPVVGLIPEVLWRLLGPLETIAKILVPKILASGVTLVWNFVWYNKVIFRHKNSTADALIALD